MFVFVLDLRLVQRHGFRREVQRTGEFHFCFPPLMSGFETKSGLRSDSNNLQQTLRRNLNVVQSKFQVLLSVKPVNLAGVRNRPSWTLDKTLDMSSEEETWSHQYYKTSFSRH